MTQPTARAFLGLSTLVLCLFISACATNGNEGETSPTPVTVNPFSPNPEVRTARLGAEQLYVTANAAMLRGDFTLALDLYGDLDRRFPFTKFATQGQLERIYSLHGAFRSDEALATATRFLRAHPRHPNADYVHYIKGVINFERESYSAIPILNFDTTKRDPVHARLAFEDFSLLLNKYPKTKFGKDARQRMIFLRNRIAQYDLHIASYYLKRGAYTAAIRRSEEILKRYQGTSVIKETLEVMATSYEKLGLERPAMDTREVLNHNFPEAAKAPTQERGIFDFFAPPGLDEEPSSES